ncbi:eukaryotic translation initiation factor 4E [Rhodotorula paludigena]|uniref:eukaryotic translation initiation factor 4E n=1 Tax=Rhodotorula paludigena TaxID=86838 RepID=UPI003176B207
MSSRSSLLSQNSRRREPSFPSTQTRGSSSLTGQALGAPPAPAGDIWGTPQRKQGGPSLSLALNTSPNVTIAKAPEDAIHPLKYTWDVWFAQRQGGTKGGKKDEQGKTANNAQKESREDWEGGVVKLGGFSSIESLHPFLAHLVPPSALPGSAHSTHTIFSPDSPNSPPSPSNVICDYNVFRSSIAPAWEDAANVGGGRWVLRLRKGVADRVWEEVVYALVSERIGGEEERVGEKVNGVVLSVRKDEDILSLWVAPSSRAERDIIRDALRLALSPLLTSVSASSLQLDYKPHPVTGGASTSTPLRLQDLSGNGDSPSPRHHLRRHDNERRSHSGALRSRETSTGPNDEHDHLRLGALGSAERRSHGGTSRGFSSYVSRGSSALGGSPASGQTDGGNAFERIERRVRESSPGVIGGAAAVGGAFGRGVRSRESSTRAGDDDATRWGRL